MYALHTLYVVDEFADQVFFGCIPGLATQRDHITLGTGGGDTSPFDRYESLLIVE
jgi:hypothetical protein